MSELDSILQRLTDVTAACGLSEWSDIRQDDLDLPGFYAWCIDGSGAELTTARLGEHVSSGIIYLGQAGAERGRPSAATLRSRLGGDHIGGKIRNSTFRLSVAAILLEDLNNFIVGDRKIGTAGEQMVSNWMFAHLRLTFVPFVDRTRICELEALLLSKLNPPVNLDGMPLSDLRVELRRRRSFLRRDPPSGSTLSVDSAPPVSTKRLHKAGQVTLHDEISDILTAVQNRWMSTADIAQRVNDRGYYSKRDQSPVTAYQIHGRTKNYPNIFEREGSRVRLLR